MERGAKKFLGAKHEKSKIDSTSAVPDIQCTFSRLECNSVTNIKTRFHSRSMLPNRHKWSGVFKGIDNESGAALWGRNSFRKRSNNFRDTRLKRFPAYEIKKINALKWFLAESRMLCFLLLERAFGFLTNLHVPLTQGTIRFKWL